jgi:asparagine N-glycosylation enzyme membrane subunit Stt3
MDESEVIQIRKDKALKFLKNNYNYVSYIILAIITFMAVRIRTSNLAGLKDITTGTWTLGPDLDPFLFLRWAKYIVEHGQLMAVDMMRYVPLGLSTTREYLLHPYMMAWFHKIAVLFGSESVTHSAVLYPAFMFGLTVIAFFFMTRKIFVNSLGVMAANAISLIASFLLSVIPVLLPRTIAGIPEKESVAFLFMFLAYFFFLASWQSKNKNWRYILAILAGVSTAGMANIWGGFQFIFIAIAPAVFIAFLFEKVDREKTATYSIWLISSLVIMIFSSGRHSIQSVTTSPSSGLALGVLFVIFLHPVLFKTNIKKQLRKGILGKVPQRVITSIISVILAIIVLSILFGPSIIFNTLHNVLDVLIKPATSRLIQTVAENRQPYFKEWASSFGPYLREIPVTFWLMFVGSIFLVYNFIKNVFEKKEIIAITLAYVILLFTVTFSRYSSSSLLNGENFISKFVYGAGFLIFVFVLGFYYYKYYKKGELEKLRLINFEFLFLLSMFFLSIVAARAAVRTVMVLVPAAAIIVGYLLVSTYYKAKKTDNKNIKVLLFVMFGIILIATIFSGYSFYQASKSTAQGYVPSVYTQQWQKAMAWVRVSTPQDAVFGHWWDYGYWLQSIGERATVLDGGNFYSYWNHLMGRYALTGPNESEALEFLYAHNTTHFLIDSTDIGKYSAFSTIGSDVNYDRASYIPTILRDQSQVQEKKNSKVFVYPSGIGLDDDIIYELNGTRVFLPSGQAGLGGILLERSSNGTLISQPVGVYVYQGRQYSIPLRYAFDNGELLDFEEGLEFGVFIYPSVSQSGNSLQIDPYGAILYLSERTVNSQLARIYLYEDKNSAFKLVHSEDDFIVSQIKAQNLEFTSDFVYYGGLRGPIRIWEIDYPGDIEFRPELIDTHYPDEIAIAR